MLTMGVPIYPMSNHTHYTLEEDDVVNAILFLLSDSSAMISGSTLPVDGGVLVQ